MPQPELAAHVANHSWITLLSKGHGENEIAYHVMLLQEAGLLIAA